MALPIIDKESLKKPLCYDPARKRFIYFDDIVSGKEKIVPIESLSDRDFKILVIERQKAGPDYRVQSISGPPMSRDDVVKAIERGEPFGAVTLEAEASALRDLLTKIAEELKRS